MCEGEVVLTFPKTARSQLLPSLRNRGRNFRFFCSVKNVEKMAIPKYFEFLKLKKF
jgi:hypothetical protein